MYHPYRNTYAHSVSSDDVEVDKRPHTLLSTKTNNFVEDKVKSQ